MIEIDEGLGRPQAIADFFPGDGLAGTFEQHRQNLKRLLLKPDSDSPLPQLAGAKIDLEHGKTQTDGRGALCHGMDD